MALTGPNMSRTNTPDPPPGVRFEEIDEKVTYRPLREISQKVDSLLGLAPVDVTLTRRVTGGRGS